MNALILQPQSSVRSAGGAGEQSHRVVNCRICDKLLHYANREMFVRWQRQKQTHSALLVESYRDNGKPRQRHIAYLGSIRIRFINKALPRAHFWDHVMTALNSRSITGTQRQQLVQAIAQVVPPPTKADVRREEKALRARFTCAARLKKQVTRPVRGVALEQKPD